jgi:type IV secretory pathway TrbD component
MWIGPPLEHLQIIHKELKDALALQLAEIDGYDSKATTMLTPIGLLLGLGVNGAGHIGPSLVALWLFNLGLLVLLAGLLAGIYALRLREVQVAPTATGLWPEYAIVGTEEMLARECSTIREVYAHNARIRGMKSPWIRRQFLGLIAGTLLLAVGYGIKAAAILK